MLPKINTPKRHAVSAEFGTRGKTEGAGPGRPGFSPAPRMDPMENAVLLALLLLLFPDLARKAAEKAVEILVDRLLERPRRD